ncbi:hypothetical protein MKZ38_005039 [Zalerion maritima]|uniref:Uncharacterized protein n=1 Tax=Zalerion maritima TaxID=339359 RepID=A0AAD5RLU0_9PEZI|nr:hypothetical protein MKZ38_005039 [Zalerion maritima]
MRRDPGLAYSIYQCGGGPLQGGPDRGPDVKPPQGGKVVRYPLFDSAEFLGKIRIIARMALPCGFRVRSPAICAEHMPHGIDRGVLPQLELVLRFARDSIQPWLERRMRFPNGTSGRTSGGRDTRLRSARRYSPVEVKDNTLGLKPATIVRRSDPVVASHRRIVLSRDADAISRPSGEKEMAVTEPS